MDGRRGGGRPGLPSLPSGWYLDDLVHRAQFLEVGPLTDGSNMTHRMFDFVSGDPGQLLAYKELGVGPGTTARVQRARRGAMVGRRRAQEPLPETRPSRRPAAHRQSLSSSSPCPRDS